MSASSSSRPVQARGDPKRRSIVAAATRVFLAQGYEAASMDGVAAEAGASKRTVYNHFPSKRDLFRAVVGALYAGLLESEPGGMSADEPPEKALPRFVRKLLVYLRRPEVTGLLRLVISEQHRFPELAQDLQSEGKGVALGLLETYLAAQHARRRLDIADPRLAAQQLMGAVKEVLFWPVMLGQPVRYDDGAVIARAVEGFLAAHRR